MRPIDREIFSVEREDLCHSALLRGTDKRRIREIHREVLVLPHEVPHPGSILRAKRYERDVATIDHLPQSILSSPGSQEEHGLGHDRPGRRERLANLFDCPEASFMVPIARANEGDEGPGVDQDQRRARSRLRSKLATRLPVLSERLRGPPTSTPIRWAMRSYGDFP